LLRKYSLFLFVFLSAISVQAQILTNGQAARAVYGQINFTTGSAVPSQQVLGAPSGIAYYNGQLFVADDNVVGATPVDHRIMVFPTSQMPGLRDNIFLQDSQANGDCYLCGFFASFSLGQTVFTSVDSSGNQTSFSPGISASAMNLPTAVATDGHIFAVADTNNNRVLIWKTIPTMMNQPADLVLGQPNFTTAPMPPQGYVDAKTMRGPQGVWIQNNKLFVADTQDYRILIWNSIPTTNNQPADLELGQPSLTSPLTAPNPTSSNPVAAANRLLNPVSVTSDGTRLFVSDLGFNRVLIWNSIPTTMDQNADVVLGQPDMVSTAANNSAVCGALPTGIIGECQNSLNYPRFALSDGSHLWIADGGNDRVLYWNYIPTSNGAWADRVIGQPDFVSDVVSSAAISIASTAIDNTGSVDTIPSPNALALDEKGNLYVSDPYNRRVVVYTPGDTLLPANSVVNWASEIIRQEGIVVFTGTIVANDTVSITIQGTAYTYTEKKTDTLDTIAKALVGLINASDPNVTALFAGVGSGSVYLSSKQTNLAYDSITLAASSSNTSDVTATASGSYLSAGTAATAAIGMLVEVDGTGLSDNTASATLDGVTTLPNMLGGSQVYMDGYPAPLLKVSPTQIITQVPYNYQDRNSTSVYVRTEHNNGSVTVTNPVAVYIAGANPGIFNAPQYPGQQRPWPVSMAYHQPGNPTAVVSIDGSVTAGNTATITIAGTAYTYTVVAADTLTTIQTALINLINASDPNVTATAADSFNRIILTAIQSGAAGNGITVTGTASTNADVTVTAYSATTCCVVVPNSLITPANPAGAGELITLTTAGLGIIVDPSGVAQGSLGTGVPFAGPTDNTAYNFVSATLGGSTAQVINAYLPQKSYGTYNVQIVVPSNATNNLISPLYIAQNAFISNTVTIPVGTPVLANPSPPTTLPTVSPFTIYVDNPTMNQTLSGTNLIGGWAFDANAPITGIQILVDGQLFGNATIGVARPDVCLVHPNEPGCPNLGWTYNLQTNQLTDGPHTLNVRAIGADGLHYSFAQAFSVANAGVANATQSFVDSPVNNGFYRGIANFSGWALNDTKGISSVSISVDSVIIGTATYGSARPDVCVAYPGRTNCPNVGWTFQYDTNQIADGVHTFGATATTADGQVATSESTFTIANYTGQSSTLYSVDTPNANSGTLSGLAAVGGWAIDANSAVSSVTVAVDGIPFGSGNYGVARTDVCTVYPGYQGCPNVGFSTIIDTTTLSDGGHELQITINLVAGQSLTIYSTFTVANIATTANPISVYIDTPAGGASFSGNVPASGWAISKTSAISSVVLLVDGRPFTTAAYGSNRPDVCAGNPGVPGCPNVGWSGNINASLLGNGTHTLQATATSTSGQRATTSSTFTINNTASGPGRVSIDAPGAVSNPYLGVATFSGWALNDKTSVKSVSVTVDGIPYGTATYNLPRPDVCKTYPGRAGCPNVGWSFTFDTTQLADGAHTVGITENNADGTFATVSDPFTVANYTTSNPMHLFIDTPIPSVATPIFGTQTIQGWAIDDNSSIQSVVVSIDGSVVGNAAYGVSRADVCLSYPDRGCPNVGYTFSYNTTFISNGIHTLSITGITPLGQTSTISEQISVSN
jgi:uncharacterized protein (TIGR03437 family)